MCLGAHASKLREGCCFLRMLRPAPLSLIPLTALPSYRSNALQLRHPLVQESFVGSLSSFPTPTPTPVSNFAEHCVLCVYLYARCRLPRLHLHSRRSSWRSKICLFSFFLLFLLSLDSWCLSPDLAHHSFPVNVCQMDKWVIVLPDI